MGRGQFCLNVYQKSLFRKNILLFHKSIKCYFHLLCTEQWIGVYTHRFTCKFSVILIKTLFIAILKVTCLLKCLCRQENLRTIWISWFLLSISNLKNADIEMRIPFPLESIISQIHFIEVLNIKSGCMISLFMIQTS